MKCSIEEIHYLVTDLVPKMEQFSIILTGRAETRWLGVGHGSIVIVIGICAHVGEEKLLAQPHIPILSDMGVKIQILSKYPSSNLRMQWS